MSLKSGWPMSCRMISHMLRCTRSYFSSSATRSALRAHHVICSQQRIPLQKGCGRHARAVLWCYTATIIPKHHHHRLSLSWHGEQRVYDAMPLTAAHTDCRAGWSCSITLTRATLFAGTPLRSSIVWPEPPDPPHTSEVVWSAPRFGVQLWLLSPSDGCELPGAPGQWFCAVSCGTVIQWSDRIQDAPYRGLRLFQIPHLQARTPVLPNDSGTNSVSCCLLCFVVQDKKQAHEQNLNLHRHVHDSRSTCTCIDIDTPTSIPTSRKY